MSSDEVKAIVRHMDAHHLEAVTKIAEVDAKVDAVDAKVDAVDAKVDAIGKAVSTDWKPDDVPC